MFIMGLMQWKLKWINRFKKDQVDWRMNSPEIGWVFWHLIKITLRQLLNGKMTLNFCSRDIGKGYLLASF